MKRSIWIFLLAIIVPSAVLGWLALRSAGEQQIILERQTAELYQAETENVAGAIRALIDEERRAFNDAVRRLLATTAPAVAAGDFPAALEKAWARKTIGFAIGEDGHLLSPTPQRAQGNREWQRFLLGNSAFLAGSTPATVYWISGEELARPEQLRKSKTSSENALADATDRKGPPFVSNEKLSPAREKAKGAIAKSEAPLPAAAPAPAELKSAAAVAEKEQFAATKDAANTAPQTNAAPRKNATTATSSIDSASSQMKQDAVRNVAPQRLADDAKQVALSQLTSATADFRAVTTGTDEGVITRFVQDQLEIIFWLRPASADGLIFGCLLTAESMRELWPAALASAEKTRGGGSLSRGGSPDFLLALLDDKTRPVSTFPASAEVRDWKRPFVASEIGEALPHWEAALYLQNPEQLRDSARVVRRTLVFLILAALGAILLGGWLVAADVRRQLALAQQKTDFVSNVSHELKTPLTSIRMFAELMQNGRGETAKHPQYLRIIMVEAERLTRLINNVLDFARLERRQKQFEMKPLDLQAVIARTWEGWELHLREAGFTTRWQAAPGPYPMRGDEDALAQVLVNLLSNAEKYAGERKDVELRSQLEAGHVFVSVLDRGLGVPAGDARKIFESFHRAHDSLSSGISGSGLGLTLAQRLVQEHGGEIIYRAREGGGSEFTVRLRVESPFP